ncbi:hypothetical protein V6N12_024339 [Hibiscus sabdariffa]|uniref:Uncharacterized protein n=1 Tax=Hibiscus sabdariffa TaxID=183260 RepID=A0ABR2G0B2_9ROSI
MLSLYDMLVGIGKATNPTRCLGDLDVEVTEIGQKSRSRFASLVLENVEEVVHEQVAPIGTIMNQPIGVLLRGCWMEGERAYLLKLNQARGKKVKEQIPLKITTPVASIENIILVALNLNKEKHNAILVWGAEESVVLMEKNERVLPKSIRWIVRNGASKGVLGIRGSNKPSFKGRAHYVKGASTIALATSLSW